MFPKVGGQYVYLREAYNKLVAFLYGWTLFLVIQTGVIAAVAVAFAQFTGVLIPWFSESNVLLEVDNLPLLGSFKFSTVQLLAIAMLVFHDLHEHARGAGRQAHLRTYSAAPSLWPWPC